MIQEFFTSSQNAAFVWALIILTVLSLVIVAGALLGAINLPEADGDLEVNWESDGVAAGLLEYFGVAAMPLSIFVLVATCSFFVTGYGIQMVALNTKGSFLPGWIAKNVCEESIETPHHSGGEFLVSISVGDNSSGNRETRVSRRSKAG
jgi:hypothetical protein